MKKMGDACGNDKGQIFPDLWCSSMKSSVAFHSSGERGYTLPTFGMKVSFMLISWSYGQEEGRSLAVGSSNTFLKAEYSGAKRLLVVSGQLQVLGLGIVWR